MPHPKYVAARQIPPSPGKGEGQMPGGGGGGEMCELRIDRYILQDEWNSSSRFPIQQPARA